jgi:hypothetical protein
MTGGSRNTVILIVTRLWVGSLINIVSIPGRGKIFFFSPERTDRLWGRTRFPIQRIITAAVSPGVKRPDRKFDCLHRMPRIRLGGVIFPFPYMPLWHAYGQLDFVYFTLS